MTEPQVSKTDVEARQGVRSGRVIIVLATSLALGLMAMFAVLAYVYASYSPFTGQ